MNGNGLRGVARIFEIHADSAGWRYIDDRPPDISVFMPADADARVLNTGQGEGQALIDGVECGFYYRDDGVLEVIVDVLSSERARALVSQICSHLSQSSGAAFSWREKREQ